MKIFCDGLVVQTPHIMADNKESIDLTKLDGSNYSVWHFGITLILNAENLNLVYVKYNEFLCGSVV